MYEEIFSPTVKQPTIPVLTSLAYNLLKTGLLLRWLGKSETTPAIKLEKQNKAAIFLKTDSVIRYFLLKLQMEIFSCDCDLAGFSPRSLGSNNLIYLNANIFP